MGGTIMDTLRAAMHSPGLPIQNKCLAEGLERFKIQQVMCQAEARHKENYDIKLAENRTSAVSDTIPSELEALSKLFDD